MTNHFYIQILDNISPQLPSLVSKLKIIFCDFPFFLSKCEKSEYDLRYLENEFKAWDFSLSSYQTVSQYKCVL